MTRSFLSNQRLNFNLLIMFLGSTLIICVTGGLALTFVDKAVPDSVIGLGATALGGLITAFVRPPQDDPMPVEVITDDQPVQVTAVDSTRSKSRKTRSQGRL